MENNDWILLEDRSIYDGWCAKIHKKTLEIVWREAWFTERLDKTFRDNWEFDFRNSNPQYRIMPTKTSPHD